MLRARLEGAQTPHKFYTELGTNASTESKLQRHLRL